MTDNKLTKEEIINALNKVDRDLRSFVILANPINKELLKEFESKCRIEVSPHIPEDIAILGDILKDLNEFNKFDDTPLKEIIKI